MSQASVSGHFIQGAKGPIFVLLRKPARSILGCVLVVPPFAEEMNKCRRMVTEVGIDLAERGIATLVPDLYGTGDSGGDFADADWGTWLADIRCTVAWAARSDMTLGGVLAVRLGCALAVDASAKGFLPGVGQTVLWQPVLDGRRYVTQFLRLRLAASLMDDRKETMSDLRGFLQRDGEVEVAGYRLSSTLVNDLDNVQGGSHIPSELGDISLIEVSREAEPRFSADTSRLLDETASLSGRILGRVFPGEPFWASAEIVTIREVIDATVATFEQRRPVSDT